MSDEPTPTRANKRAASAEAADLGDPPSGSTNAPETNLASEEPSVAKDKYKEELQATVAVLRGELERYSEERERVLATSGMTLEQARALSDMHMDRLHRYNDIKDAGQVLFGKLAELRGKTVKEMHQEYGVESDD
ncbi:hypothetical protein LPJ73_009044 [Coemansia sp. RSA 2703]|nr:hypothetical protein LPJ73_009044 [Coemansia sp. RSA 2703]